jgi:glycosyltransferase involved in cell wall biosynthesis
MYGHPAVSVLISTYNRAECLHQAIRSVLNQTFQDFELIVADDGSTDHTAEVCVQYKDRVKYFHQQNSGLGSARQLALQHAVGKYLAWLDSDDTWKPEKLNVAVAFLEANRVIGWVHSDAHEVDSGGTIIHDSYLKQFGLLKMEGRVYDEMLSTCFTLTSTVVMRRQCLEKLHRFDTSLRYGGDVDFFLRCSMYYPLGLIQEPLVYRLLHEKDAKTPNLIYDEIARISCRIPIFEKALASNSALTADQYKRTLAELQLYKYRLAELYWRDCDFSESRRLFLESLGWNAHTLRASIYAVTSFLPASLIMHLRRGKQRFGYERNGYSRISQ